MNRSQEFRYETPGQGRRFSNPRSHFDSDQQDDRSSWDDGFSDDYHDYDDDVGEDVDVDATKPKQADGSGHDLERMDTKNHELCTDSVLEGVVNSQDYQKTYNELIVGGVCTHIMFCSC